MGIGSFISNPIGAVTDAIGITDSGAGQQAANASIAGAETTAAAQREALDYMKEVEKLPLSIRDKFLPMLSNIFGSQEGQQSLIDRAKNSPLYQSIMGGLDFGNKNILRNASATGGLRSGNTNAELTDYGTQLQNQALLSSFDNELSGIRSLAGIPLNTNAVAAATAAPGMTLGQGQIAAGQAIQDQSQANMNSMSNIFGSGIAALPFLSDIRLKENIIPIGFAEGYWIYRWDWKPEAENFGHTGEGRGVMAHDVYDKCPDATCVNDDGYIMVDYSKLGVH
jgi:hypothetical protein